MTNPIYELQGYTIVLSKVIHVTRVFEAQNEEGIQFNIRCLGDVRLAMKFPDQAEAVLQHRLFIKALSEC